STQTPLTISRSAEGPGSPSWWCSGSRRRPSSRWPTSPPRLAASVASATPGGSPVPELPEVEALVRFLAEKGRGQVIERIEVAALSALKTYAPPVEALKGR